VVRQRVGLLQPHAGCRRGLCRSRRCASEVVSMKFKRMSEVDLRGKRVFIRADLNVPVEDGRVSDDTRIRASLPAIKYALEQGAAVMVTSHLGRPTEGELKPEDSLAPVARRLAELLGRDVPLLADWVDGVTVRPGQVVLLENCRVNKGEKKDDPALARKIAALCDVYVNDAFGTAHRAEATTHAVARYAKVACAGPLMAAELDALGKALAQPARPLVAIVAGSKVSTKLTILDALAKKVDSLIVGGGIANTFLLAAGKPIGKSLAEPGLAAEANKIARTTTVPLPSDVVVGRSLEDSKGTTKPVDAVAADEMILDIGPKTAQELAGALGQAPSSGTDRSACSRTRPSPKAPRRWRAPSPGRRPTPSPAAATRSRRSTSSALPRTSTTSRPPVAHSSNSWRARNCRRSRRSKRAPMLKQLSVRTPGQGLHEVTQQVAALVRQAGVGDGLCTLFIRHTSASLIIQENADPTAKRDLERWLNRLVPEGDPFYQHDTEGPDDMP